jgi:hypothetical protein
MQFKFILCILLLTSPFVVFFYLPLFPESISSDPDFLIIGCMKSGTSQLTYFLSQHPNIGCFYDEVHFFDNNFDQGREWYQRHLPEKSEKVFVTGEDSPSYICNERVPSRVFSMYPNIKLIAILRNPVDRTYSHYQMRVRRHHEPVSFEEALAIEEKGTASDIKGRVPPDYPYLETSMYVKHLERWFSFFPRDQMFIIFSDELKNRPLDTLNRVCAFLGVPPFAQMPAEDPVLTRKYPPMNADTRNCLEQFFAPYNIALENLLGVPIPWNSLNRIP